LGQILLALFFWPVIKSKNISMKKIIFYLVASLIIMIGATGCHNNDDSSQAAKQENDQKFDSTDIKKDAVFAVNVADANMLEIKLGQLADSAATASYVKDLGSMMVNDHTKAGEELKKIANDENITLPDSLSDKATNKYNNLAGKHGTDFDKSFTQMMIDDHKDVIDAFQKEANNGNDSTLKNWASNTLPTLQHHLDMSDSVMNLLNK
jgi:putative membrane protein